MLSDPFAEFCGSFSHDRSLRLYSVQNFKTSKLAKMAKVISKFSLGKRTIQKEEKPNKLQIEEPPKTLFSENINITNKSSIKKDSVKSSPVKSQTINQFIFIDSNKQEGLFQRANWSPCGWFFLAPCCQLSKGFEDKKQNFYGSYMFSRTDFQKPVMFYPTGDKVIIAKFSNCLYERIKIENLKKSESNKIMEELNEETNKLELESDEKKHDSEVDSPFDLSYNLSFILATYSSILVYTTKSVSPLFKLENIHYAGISDITWHSSGFNFCVSSLDGFITFCSLKQEDLGRKLTNQEMIQNEDVLNKNLKKREEFLFSKKAENNPMNSHSRFKVTNKVTFSRKAKPAVK